MINLRSSFLHVLVVVLAVASSARAVDRPPKLDESVDRALAYLAKQQRPDGWFDHQVRPEGKDADASGHRRAITGLCALAFLSAGHAPDEGRYGPVVRKAVDALVNAVPDDGYVGKLDEKPMYTQAIVTLAVAQAAGAESAPERSPEKAAERRQKQQAALRRLVKVIVDAQSVKKDAPHAGGWRYQRDAPDSDLSLSGWNALALRGAVDAGVPVPADALKRAAEYVAGCHDPARKGFAYQPGGELQAGATATGVLCLYLLERQVRPEATAAARTLADRPFDAAGTGPYPFYATFYVAQASAQAGDDVWRAAGRPALERLIKAQEADGSWPRAWPYDNQEPGRVYRAAVATLALTVPYRVLPVYQR